MLRPKRPALVAIDMQQAFDLPGRPRRWNADLDRNGHALLAGWRARGLPIIHVRNDSVDPESWFHPDHPGNALRPGFEPRPGEALVSKSVNSAFIGADLDLCLRRLGADEVVVFGMRTDMCVSSTARSGANLGWPMIVVGDACDCCDLPDPFGEGIIRAEEVHRVHLATLAEEFARLVTTDDMKAALET
jgi:nicotinamidase-related amidase